MIADMARGHLDVEGEVDDHFFELGLIEAIGFGDTR
jgi:hypothetical protein